MPNPHFIGGRPKSDKAVLLARANQLHIVGRNSVSSRGRELVLRNREGIVKTLGATCAFSPCANKGERAVQLLRNIEIF